MRNVSRVIGVTLLAACMPLGIALHAQQAPAPVGLRGSLLSASLPLGAWRPSSALLRASGNRLSIRDVSTVGEGRIQNVALGAGLGFLVGTIVGSELASRCRPVTEARCTMKHRRVKHIVSYGLLGGLLGGAVGALTMER